jgi:hypothetical protein
MKLLHPVRLGVLLTAVAGVALGLVVLNPGISSADDVAGQYSLSVHATDATGIDVTSIEVGQTFEARVGISYPGVAPEDCFASVPPPFGCYQAAQWNLDYDETILQTAVETCTGAAQCTHIARVTGSPTNCNQEAENGLRTLVGCFSISGADISYEGDTIRITYTCLAAGTSPLTLTTESQGSFVSDGSADQPIHLHNDSITCTGGTAPTNTPVLPTVTPVPPTATSVPATATSVPATATSVPATATSVPATATSVPATATSVPATATSVPGTATSVPATATSVPATATSVPATATSVPATATSVPATATSVPATATSVPATNTPAAPTNTPQATNTPNPTNTPGGGVGDCDLNNDGRVTGQDVSIVARDLSRQNGSGDVNNDGKTSLIDLAAVIKAMHTGECAF